MIRLPVAIPVAQYKPRVLMVMNAEECTKDLIGEEEWDKMPPERQHYQIEKNRICCEQGFFLCAMCGEIQKPQHIHIGYDGAIICSEGCAIAWVMKHGERDKKNTDAFNRTLYN